MLELIQKLPLEYQNDEILKKNIQKINDHPYNPWAYSSLGDYLLKINQAIEAKICYEKALELNPVFHGFYSKLGKVNQKLGNFDQSNFYYATSINLNSKNYWDYDDLCQNLIAKNQISQAITYYHKALTLKQELPRIYRQLGSLYSEKGELQNAINYYYQVIEINPNQFDYFYLAELLLKNKEIEQAIIYYQKVLELEQNHQKAHQGLADALIKKGNLEQGIAHYQKAKLLKISCLKKNFSLNTKYSYLVNHKYFFVYCPIPKVACSSFKKLLLKINEPQKFTNIRKNISGIQFHAYIENAYSLLRYREQEINDILQSNKYFKFVFVRNPWNRLVSAYLDKFLKIEIPSYSLKVIKSFYEQKKVNHNHKKSITFRDFIHYLMITADQDLDGHWKPQYLFLGNTKFDFIGKFENIEQDFKYIKQKLNLEVDLDWVNKIDKTDNHSQDNYADYYPNDLKQLDKIPSYQSFYTPELVELVRKRYQTDIEMFNYEFT